MMKLFFEAITEKYNLGILLSLPSSVIGGLIHTMWRLETDTGTYAVKQLNAEIMQKAGIIAEFEQTETVADMLSQRGHPAISGIRVDGKAVHQIQDKYVIVYPWQEGVTLSTAAATSKQGHIIGQIIGRIHGEHLEVQQKDSELFPVFSDVHLRTIVKQYNDFSGKNPLDIDLILDWNKNAETIMSELLSHTVLSHGDIDQKNVIWKTENEPLIIDWECLNAVSPDLEIVDAALNWAGIVSGELDESVFLAVLEGYKSASGAMHAPMSEVLAGCRLKWLAWLEFNLQRACNEGLSAEERELGEMEVGKTYRTIQLVPTHI